MLQQEFSGAATRGARARAPSHERRLDAAVNHIGKRWLPVNAAVLDGIKERLQDGDYLKHREALAAEIKNDPALYLYCSRELAKYSGSDGMNPITKLLELDEPRLLALFDVSARDISRHELPQMSMQQALSLQYTLFASHAAEELGKGTGCDAALAFSAAYFRRLGENLVAWNYPKLYADAIAMQRRQQGDLSSQLTQMLGVSPARIGERLASDWGIDGQILRAVNPGEAGGGKVDLARIEKHGVGLAEICQVAELFGRLKDPITFPEAEAEWAKSAAIIEDQIDTSVLKNVEEKVSGALQQFAGLSDAVLALPGVERQAGGSATGARDALRANPYVRKCPPAVQQAFQRVYGRLSKKQVSVPALHELINHLVPELGFKRGCLFLAKRPAMELVPVLRIGDLPLEAYIPFVRNAQGALRSVTPYKYALADSHFGTHVCGALGSYDHPGVLYLELDDRSSSDPQHETLLYFHALRYAMIHCFGATPDPRM